MKPLFGDSFGNQEAGIHWQLQRWSKLKLCLAVELAAGAVVGSE